MNVIKNIANLPDNIILKIFNYIPRQKLIFVNTEYYNSYHYLIKNYISIYESYTRNIIRKDNGFVFKNVIKENFENWIKNKQYRYKNMIFINYIYFVLYYCRENNSNKCCNILIDELLKRDLCKNQPKKNIIKYIKWKI